MPHSRTAPQREWETKPKAVMQSSSPRNRRTTRRFRATPSLHLLFAACAKAMPSVSTQVAHGGAPELVRYMTLK